ncbi:hypothetical protein M4578_00770 [Salipiger sp. P9]|uniref:hypothetical protein n=1 Tax=Salipiger pentaromativorans TaxID=2943193 RepID=UPI0021570CE9|nr:hypothetical protein [Salipiger pentaromativorans]MCR8546343.1 hypothetical protein [Salipiger pentaromativorans]
MQYLKTTAFLLFAAAASNAQAQAFKPFITTTEERQTEKQQDENPPAALEAQSLQSIIETAEGEYGAKLSIGMGYADFLVSVTQEGVQVDINGTMWKCTQVVDPETAETYVSEQGRGTCETGKFEAVRNDDKSLTFNIDTMQKPVTLPFLSGNMGAGWIETVPSVATIKGVTLGQPMPTTAADVDGYSVFRDRGRLSRFSETSIGMMGFRKTNYFEGATYVQLTEPRDLPDTAGSVSLDHLGVYGVNGRVVAVLRRQEPLADEAPRYEAVQEALGSTYGTPTITRRSGAGSVYEWHFNAQGQLLDSQAGSTCQSRFDSDRTDSRYVLLEQKELKTTLQEIMEGQPVRVVDAVQVMKLRVAAACSYSIRYHIHPSDEGLLKTMTASMYAYDPVRTDIWGERKKTLEKEIAENLSLQKSSRKVAPDL